MTNPGVSTHHAIDVLQDGSLSSGGDYVYWTPGREEVRLEGAFTVEQLQFIVEHMTKMRREQRRKRT
jgi:hypothetical protein